MIRWLNLPFLEQSTPPPFYQQHLSESDRVRLDKAFIGQESQAYYLRQFRRIDEAGRLIPSFNWAAFAMTFGWLLYRKRFLDCFVYCVAGWSFIKLTIVISLSILEYLLVRHLPSDIQWQVRVGVGVGIWLFWSYQVGCWANAYYYRQARREIADVLEQYPTDKSAQEAHLKEHGSISYVGMLTAFGLFGTLLSIIALQFVPIWAMQKEQEIIYNSYQTVNEAHKRVAAIYQRTQQCPTQLPLSATGQMGVMTIHSRLDGAATDCAITFTVNNAHYPVRYLNGQTLSMYKPTEGGQWRCVTSLNKQQHPKRCI